MKNDDVVVIFGGSGFIGTHLAKYLIENELASKVYCADIVQPRYFSDKLFFCNCDVRNEIELKIEDVEVIFNFAAIHQTPGHRSEEYFTTNVLGARNICKFAASRGINTIVFTSSISPYGPSEDLKTEEALPQPVSAYGISKLIAECVHQIWLAEDSKRKLEILRPGVVFGYGEKGNFTRLYQSLKGRFFFYAGRKDTKKACIYVKDLVRACYEMSQGQDRFQIFNMCYEESPSIESIVNAVSEITSVPKTRIVLPFWLLIGGALIISNFAKMVGKNTGIHPERIVKLMTSTNISGEKLVKSSFALKFTLQEAIADWYKDCKQEGLF